MPQISIFFIRTALIYLVTGFSLGGLLLYNKAYLFSSNLWQLIPIHYFMLFYGWVIQLAFGVAFWIMPKAGKFYGNTDLAWLSYGLLNSGLITLIISFLLLFLNSEIKFLYLLATILIYIGIACFIFHIWPRVRLVIAVIPPKTL